MDSIYELPLPFPLPLTPKEKRNKEGAIPRREKENGKMWLFTTADVISLGRVGGMLRHLKQNAHIVVAAEPGPGLPAVRHHGHVLRASRRHPPPLLENLHDGAHQASTN